MKPAQCFLKRFLSKEVSKYGIAKLEKPFFSQGTTSRVLDILEKPDIKKAPSRYAAVGRYIFDNHIFDHISNSSRDGKEIEITDAIKYFMNEGNMVNATT